MVKYQLHKQKKANYFMNMFDKRIELLEGLALAVKLKDKTITKEEVEDIDFVEYNDIPYVNELLEKIDEEV